MGKIIRVVLSKIKERPCLSVLVLLLLVITFASIKPGFYFLGWDNYSSYFNQPNNLFRTLFATWREYRGLGVPSDAETTDIFRQLFYFLLHFIIPEQLLDQIYYLMALWLGILGMYALVNLILKDTRIHSIQTFNRFKDLFSGASAFFYLFNLNTLSIFYSPIIPFTNRFYSLPLILYFFIRFIRSTKKARSFIVLALIIILTSGSYITPTVITTSIIALFIFLLMNKGVKRALLYIMVFLALNAFWALPFVNYAIQRSSIIPLARTFVEINESTLNKSPSAYSLEKQSTLFPSFLEMSFQSLNNKPYTIHPLLNEFNSISSRILFLILPVLYCLGSILILWHWKKNKKIAWIPIWISLFLFLSLKEYSPLGFLYIWLKQRLPFFDILFRISDTKFHSYISLAGSIAAGYAIVLIVLFLKRRVFIIFILSLFLLVSVRYAWVFRSYFTGNLFINFMYVKIPKAYFSLAKDLNSRKDRGRVLHLPMDTWHQYWRSFNWGYIGSAFFNYLLNKPYIDKTFEPASMENAYLHSKITSLLDSFHNSTDNSYKQKTASDFLKILQQTGIQYVILDESISSESTVRNTLYTAKQYFVRSQAMTRFLKDINAIQLLNTYTVPVQEILSSYKNLYPVSKTGFPDKTLAQSKIELYEVPDTAPVFGFLSSTRNIDPNIKNLFETEIDNLYGNIQNTEKPAALYPFQQQNHKLQINDSSIVLKYDLSEKKASNYLIETSDTKNDSYLIDVYGRVEGGNLYLTFYHRYYPDINDSKFARNIGSLRLALPDKVNIAEGQSFFVDNFSQNPDQKILDNYRLRLNEIFVPIPSNLSNQDIYFYSFMSHEKAVKASLLEKTSNKTFNGFTFNESDPTACYGAKMPGYKGDMKVNNRSLLIEAQNGTYCAKTALVLPEEPAEKQYYIELDLQMKNNKQDKETTHAYICMHRGLLPECINTHRHIRIFNASTKYTIPINAMIANMLETNTEIGLVNPTNSKQSLFLENMMQNNYSVIKEEKLGFEPVYPQENIELTSGLQISVPKTLSYYSYLHHPQYEAFAYPQESCRAGKPSTRRLYYFEDTLVNSMEDCSVYFAQEFQYAFQSPYIFAFEYWLGSGQQPLIVLGKKHEDYLTERIGLYQGYPNIANMKQYQVVSSSRLIYPQYVKDQESQIATMHIFQDTANTGLLAIRGFNMMEYPKAWENLAFVPYGATAEYSASSGPIIYKQLLPSLWKVSFQNIGKQVLFFNEGYDKQWGLYDSIWGLLFGKSLTRNNRCYGYANCFEINNTEKGSITLYVFYLPERLSAIGWLLSLSSVLILAVLLRKRSIDKVPR